MRMPIPSIYAAPLDNQRGEALWLTDASGQQLRAELSRDQAERLAWRILSDLDVQAA